MMFHILWMDTSKSFSKVHKIDEKWTVPLNELLYNIVEDEYLINTTSSGPKTSLLLS